MKLTHLLVLLLTISTIIAGCGFSPAATAPAQPTDASAMPQPTASAAPTAPQASAHSPAPAPVSVRVFATPGTKIDLATNSFSKAMEQRFNMRFVWQTTSDDDGTIAQQKRQASLLGDSYPDLYLLGGGPEQFSQAEILRYGQQGIILPLNGLIEQYAPHIKDALAHYPTLKAFATAPDGKIYGLPQFNECYHCSYPNKLWINTKWLKKLGLDAPTTTAEFKAVLEAFKTRDPNGNGKADEVPLSGSTEDYGVRIVPYLMNGFIYDDDRTYLLLHNGSVDSAANKPEWRAGLTYIKSLYDAGLIDPNAFTQNAAAFKKLGNHTDAEVLGAGAGMHPAIFVTVGTNAPFGNDYTALPPLRGPHAAYATYNYGNAPGISFVLTNHASPAAQVAAIKLADYLFTNEGQLRGYLGEEGQDWHTPQQGDVAINQAVAPLFVGSVVRNDREKNPNHAWGVMAQYFQPRAFRDRWVQATDIASTEGYERRLQEATQLYEGKQPSEVFPHWMIWIDPAKTNEIAVFHTSINEYIEQNALLFITGVKDLDKDWDAYVAGLDQLKLPHYLALMQQAYDRSAKP